MCRFLAYRGEPLLLADLLYNPSNSLIHQASEAMESRTRINADGFGIAWYDLEVNPEPIVFKDITPAWGNANLLSLSDKVRSRCILAHVRAAQRFDPVNRANCHPFQHRRLLWMHNGDIPGRGRLRRRVTVLASDELVARIGGSTDSETAFVLFLSLLDPPLDRDVSADELARALEATIERLVTFYEEDGETRPLVLNFCVSNGRSIVATRFGRNAPEISSLHYCRGSRLVCEGGVYRMHVAGDGPRCAIVASEAMSDDPHWSAVDNGTLVVVGEDLDLEIRTLTVAA